MSCSSSIRAIPGAVASAIRHAHALALVFASVVCTVGCETDSYMDPSKTGYFEHTPTTMPVLERIDVIEPPEEPLGIAGPPSREDLLPNTLEYRLSPGDVVLVDIFELITQGQTEKSVRTIDQSGFIRLPTINEVKAGGLTLTELRDSIRAMLEVHIRNPVVTVDIEAGRSFEFTIQGAIQNAGVYALDKPNFKLTQALALANGADPVTERVLVIRSMTTENAIEREIQNGQNAPDSPQNTDNTAGSSPTQTAPPQPPVAPQNPSVDIEALINRLGNTEPVPPADTPAPTPPTAPDPPPASAPSGATPPAAASPGAVSGNQGAMLDPPEGLEGISVVDKAAVNVTTGTQVAPASQLSNEGDSFVFDVNSQQWVRIRSGKTVTIPATVSDPSQSVPSGSARTGEAAKSASGIPIKPTELRDPRAVFNTRIIEIDYDRLVRGDQSQNVVIRPGDDIYVQFPPIGVVYIDGEISRPGVFQLPSSGRLTLSRLVAAAGGLTQIAIPERVDLVRRLPGHREAAIRVNLAAIRNMSEPDIVLKRDDHVVIGTNFWATPLAIFRNGLRMTYGFGFLLDRNWGNDVFGPPPTQETINF